MLVWECIDYALALMTLSFPSCGRLVLLVMMTFGRVRLLFSTLESPFFVGRECKYPNYIHALFQPKRPSSFKKFQIIRKANPVKNGLEKSQVFPGLDTALKYGDYPK